jgi:glycosyltransferase involved in cell wall biosynthesis
VSSARRERLSIVVVTSVYADGMGYLENCLPRALARLGHHVHVVTSTYRPYGNTPIYDESYREFLGPPQTSPGSRSVDGYHLHRLASRLVSGHIQMRGLTAAVRAHAPDIVHSDEMASLHTFELAAARSFSSYRLFAETHQTMSVMRPYMKQPGGPWLRKIVYRITRAVPTFLWSFAVDRCYAQTPDCAVVARRFYGVPGAKVHILSLASDTDTYHPVESDADRAARQKVRDRLGFSERDVVCAYSGRFTKEKNPLILARAIDSLQDSAPLFKALLIGSGEQREAIASCRNTTIVPFVTQETLANYFRAIDVAVWPREESMSMIDAAASGLPIVVSNAMGEPARVEGNGKTYEEGSVESLAQVLRSFASADDRRAYGQEGRRKALASFSWSRRARVVEADYRAALGDSVQPHR